MQMGVVFSVELQRDTKRRRDPCSRQGKKTASPVSQQCSGKGKKGTSVLERKNSQMTEGPREIELLPWITAFGIEAYERVYNF